MLRNMFRCLAPWAHRYGWPQKGRQTCIDCGKEQPSKLRLYVNPAFNTPRYEPKAVEKPLPIVVWRKERA